MKTKVTFIADTHHFSPTLTDGGRAYQLRSGSDQKCLLETGALIDSAFDLLSGSDTQAVMIAGDVTDDGERASHEEFREKIRLLQKSKPVYIITATHDWCCDRNPRSYFGDTESNDVPIVDHDELRDFYFDFGPKQALSEYITDLGTFSYTVDLSDEVRLLAINDDRSGKGYAGYSDEHFDWIEAQIRQAKADGKVLLGMEHHLIMPHFHPVLSGFGMQIGESAAAASRLADAGLEYMFVGHSHIQRVSHFTTESGNTITQINIGSLVGYPGSIVDVTVEDGKVSWEVGHTESFEYNGRREQTLPYLEKHFTDMIDRVIDGAKGKDTKEFADRMAALGIRSGKIPKLHPLIRPAAKKLSKMKASGVYRLLNPVTLGRVISKNDVREYKDKPVMDFVKEVMLNAVGGSNRPHPAGSAYCNLVKSVVSVPAFFAKDNKTLASFADMAEAVITGREWSNK